MATIAADRSAPAAWRTPLFVLTILTGSFLLFLVQPMIARMALPRLGGAPAVWNSAMLVYQLLLLAGYAYAHALTRLTPRRQAAIHLALFALAALWLPLGLATMTLPADADPIVWVPWLLAASIGPLFLAVAAQAPLMQHWFGLSGEGREPYALYAASNLGSFGGLVAYPLLVEPSLTLSGQSALWTGGYILLFALIAACAFALPRATASHDVAKPIARPALMQRLRWVALAAIPSGLVLSTTTHLTTDIVAVPLIWVVPLGLYLLSFTIAFADRRRPADAITWVAPLILLALGGYTLGGGGNLVMLAAAALTLLFAVAVALHTQLYRERPAPAHLTSFYLAMAIGGALGGIAVALVAPAVLDWTYEHPLLLIGAALLMPQPQFFAALWERALVALALLMALLLFVGAVYLERLPIPAEHRDLAVSTGLVAVGAAAIGQRALFAAAVAAILLVGGVAEQARITYEGGQRLRSYFGVYTIQDSETGTRRLAHGTTLHGVQPAAPDRARELTSYYVPASGVGRGMIAMSSLKPEGARIGVVGLGAGTLACYARPADSWRFYEIDPAIVTIARTRFTYLSSCAPKAGIVLGDARLTLAREPAASLDLLALDAFSSDAIPMHLLTREAFAVYARVLAPDGLLLVHISNRHLDLQPVVAAAARDGGWSARLLDYSPVIDPARLPLATGSSWVALSREPRSLTALGKGWKRLWTRDGLTLWRDDYATILPLVKGLNDD